MRWFGVLFATCLLCQCATQHETKEFSAFYRTDPLGYFNSSYVYERAELESRAELNAWERRRLYDLYDIELRQLSKESPRFAALGASMVWLLEKSQGLGERADSARRDGADRAVREAADTSAVFIDADFKKDYQEAYKLWNRDDNEAALEKAVALVRDPRFEGRLTRKERFKAMNLEFRVALDLQNLDVAMSAYAAMRDLDDCAAETSEAGFLMAATYLGAGNAARSKEIFEQQCDPDRSASNQVKRLYWTARLNEANGLESQSQYEKIIASGVPGYYFYLAHVRLNRPLLDTTNPQLRPKEITVPSSVSNLFKEAESSLAFHLRNDAAAFLSSAAARLSSGAGKAEIPGLLYAAHLYQATGYSLEAMRVYATVTDIAQAEGGGVPFYFLREMFPTPRQNEVAAVASHWKMDPDFLYAIMRQESAFNPGAVSSAGARGLMQMMPFLASGISRGWRYDSYFTTRSLFFARENLKLSAYHLSQIQTSLPHPALMAAAYNAGSKRAANWWKRTPGVPLDVFVELIPIGETRNYVKLVLRNFVFYKLLHSGGKLEPSAVPLKLPEIAPLVL